MKILFLERDQKACNFYRILQPAEMIRKHHLADTCMIEFGENYLSQETMDKVFASDVIVIPRPSSEEWFKFIKVARKAGKIIVSDYDDDPFRTSPWNPYYRWIGTEEYQYQWPDGKKEWLWKDGMTGPDGTHWFDIEQNINRRDMCRASFAKSDLVTSTTPILADTFSKINKNSIVLPNLINLEQYERPEFTNKKIRIGWQGGVSHYEDLFFVKNIIRKVAERNPDVEVVFFGDLRLMGMFSGIKNFLHSDWVAHVAYPYKLALLGIDIGLAPLVDNEFNHNKSAIKFFEYTAVGAATVASNIPPYKGVIEPGTGLLVDQDEKAWIEAIESLIKDKRKRKSMAAKAYELVAEKHEANKFCSLWVDAYSLLLKRESELQKS